MTNAITFFQSQTIRRVRRFKLTLVAALLLAIGCYQETLSVADDDAAVVETPVLQEAESADPTESAEPVAQTYSEKLAAALEQAAAAKDAVARQIAEAGQSGGQAASGSLEWATQLFNGLRQQGLTNADSTQQWLLDDWNQAGTWQYQVVTLRPDADVAAKLNELGKDRWECFQVVPASDGATTFYLKQPSRSYLDQLPMKDVLQLLPLMGRGGKSSP